MNDDGTTGQRRLRHKQSFSNFEEHHQTGPTTNWEEESGEKEIGAQTPIGRKNTATTYVSYQTAREASASRYIDSLGEVNDLATQHSSVTGQETNSSVPRAIDSTIQQLERLLNEAVKVAQAAAKSPCETTRAEGSTEIARAGTKTSPSFASFVRTYLQKPNQPIVRNAAAETATQPSDVRFVMYRPVSQETTDNRDADTRVGTCEPQHSCDGAKLFAPGSLDLSLPVYHEANALERSQSHRIPHSPCEPLTAKTRSRSPTCNTDHRPSRLAVGPIIRNQMSNVRNQSTGNITEPRPGFAPSLQLNGEEIKDDEEYKDYRLGPRRSHQSHFTQMFGVNSRHESMRLGHPEYSRDWDPKKHKQIDVPLDVDNSELHITCNHAPIARNWSAARKRWSALIACINASSIGLIIGIYAGEVPAIQYVIIDLNHAIILGNVVLYLGLMFSTLFLWPLPLLHGRKPYIIAGLMLALSLQVPQGISVINTRLPDQNTFKVLLLLSRGLSGIALGLCDINITATMLDVFGASLQSQNPYQEVVDSLDVRRHGGGMGLWLGILSWCSIGPLSIGFMIGAFIISHTTVDWGFWTSQMILIVVLIFNLSGPELRRSAFRRTLAEMIGPLGEFGRIARGEIKMHLKSRGPS